MSDHAQPPADLRGRSVGGGRYQLLDVLGTGGMAAVYLARDTVLDRHVAVKTMHSAMSREDAFRERFKREAQSVARLAHTNIVSVFDTGEDRVDDAQVPYIVMEYVEGKPLRTELDEDIARHGAMPADKALRVTCDVLAALEISHEAGLVHRDIKPGNVMLTRRGVVKVMDFGIARATQSGVTAMTQTGMVVGTPQYLSPEQALGRGVDARSDLYSVGVMLFELLTGRLPFEADSVLAMAYAHVQEEPPAPSSFNAAIPPAIDALVARALRKNPNERHPSAPAFRAECLGLSDTIAPGAAAPRIVPGAPRPGGSGAGVAQAVFPEFGAPVTSPYAPTPPAGSYGYPQGRPATPPPYGGAPTTVGAGADGGSGRNSTWAVVLAAVVAIAVVAAVAVVVVLNNGGGDGGTAEADGGTGTEQSTEPEGGDDGGRTERRYQEGDPTRTINSSECVGAVDYGDQENHPGAVMMPDFYDIHIDSVKECIRDAGWSYDEELVYKDEVLKGEGMVVDQSPRAYGPYNPEEDGPIVLTVSTGYEPLEE
ncbi:protein kinase domain-containing protein [Streptomyces specialis]|uniref:protein kinase domain-containing protein n=1 Tax=Streptomyces specialis TaxID=498367 RepID=UPI00073ECFD8|nr:protein kinase [Streptomyces specialis]